MARDWGARRSFSTQVEVQLSASATMGVVLGPFARTLLARGYSPVSQTDRSAVFARRKANLKAAAGYAAWGAIRHGNGLLTGAAGAALEHHKDTIAVTVLSNGDTIKTTVSIVANGPKYMQQLIEELKLAFYGAALPNGEQMVCARCDTRLETEGGWCLECTTHLRLLPTEPNSPVAIITRGTMGKEDPQRWEACLAPEFTSINVATGKVFSLAAFKDAFKKSGAKVTKSVADFRVDLLGTYEDMETANIVWVRSRGTARTAMGMLIDQVDVNRYLLDDGGMLLKKWGYKRRALKLPSAPKTYPDRADLPTGAPMLCTRCGARPETQSGWCVECASCLKPVSPDPNSPVVLFTNARTGKDVLRRWEAALAPDFTMTIAGVGPMAVEDLVRGIGAVNSIAVGDRHVDLLGSYEDLEEPDTVWTRCRETTSNEVGEQMTEVTVEKYLVGADGLLLKGWGYTRPPNGEVLHAGQAPGANVASPPAPASAQASGQDSDGGPVKRCPECAEWVKDAAHVCRYCGFRFAS